MRMVQVRYLKTTHDAFAGQTKFIRGDHAMVLELAGFIEIVPTVEKKTIPLTRKARKKLSERGLNDV